MSRFPDGVKIAQFDVRRLFRSLWNWYDNPEDTFRGRIFIKMESFSHFFSRCEISVLGGNGVFSSFDERCKGAQRRRTFQKGVAQEFAGRRPLFDVHFETVIQK